METKRPADPPVTDSLGVPWHGRSTRAVVDLDAIAANVRALSRRAGQAALMTVVKGNAYGHGALMVARTALQNGAQWLGVFTAEEGVQLRRGGVTAPILVLGPFSPFEARAMVLMNLTPTVSTAQAGDVLQNAAEGRRIVYHVELDTGMTRGGVLPDQAVSLIRQLQRLSSLKFGGLYTHFAGADMADEPSAVEQLARFHGTAQELEGEGIRVPMRHAANSAATFHFPSAYFDMIRVGISTYGYYPFASASSLPPLRPALRLLSSVSRVTRVPAGTGVGYGHDFRCIRPSIIALVPIGYADGLHRSLGNGRGTALIRGHAVSIVGRVSMDQITVDVTEVPDVRIGDEVVLIGRQGNVRQTAETLAAQADTISYEVLASLLPRVPRLYIRGGTLIGALVADGYHETSGCPDKDTG